MSIINAESKFLERTHRYEEAMRYLMWVHGTTDVSGLSDKCKAEFTRRFPWPEFIEMCEG